jgi:hypothetical protein
MTISLLAEISRLSYTEFTVGLNSREFQKFRAFALDISEGIRLPSLLREPATARQRDDRA